LILLYVNIYGGHPNLENDCEYLCDLVVYDTERSLKLYSDIS